MSCRVEKIIIRIEDLLCVAPDPDFGAVNTLFEQFVEIVLVDVNKMEEACYKCRYYLNTRQFDKLITFMYALLFGDKY